MVSSWNDPVVATRPGLVLLTSQREGSTPPLAWLTSLKIHRVSLIEERAALHTQRYQGKRTLTDKQYKHKQTS